MKKRTVLWFPLLVLVAFCPAVRAQASPQSSKDEN